jgi:hypothetical protein
LFVGFSADLKLSNSASSPFPVFLQRITWVSQFKCAAVSMSALDQRIASFDLEAARVSVNSSDKEVVVCSFYLLIPFVSLIYFSTVRCVYVVWRHRGILQQAGIFLGAIDV